MIEFNENELAMIRASVRQYMEEIQADKNNADMFAEEIAAGKTILAKLANTDLHRKVIDIIAASFSVGDEGMDWIRDSIIETINDCEPNQIMVVVTNLLTNLEQIGTMKYISCIKAARNKLQASGINSSCMYCGGDCPFQEEYQCDGFAGDIDGLYTSPNEN